MATRRWQGGASPVAQVTTFAFAGTIEATDITRVTIGSKVVDFVTGSTVAATVVSSLVTAWAALSASTYPEFAEITPAVGSPTSTLSLSAVTAGKPFTVTLTPLETDGSPADLQTIEGGGVATTGTTSTASAGPNDWSTAANWSGSTVPASTDDVILDVADYPILYGLNQSAVTLTSLTIAATFSGNDGLIGLPETNSDSGTNYFEYRPTYLAISATTVNIGSGPGQGADRIKLNTGSNAATVNVFQTGFSPDADLEAFLWKGAHASNVLNVTGTASVGVAVFGGETATLPVLKLDENATVRCGAGVTLTAITVNGGTLRTASAIGTSLTQLDGTVTLDGSGAVAQLTVRGGSCTYNTTGTLGGATVVSGGGVLDFSRDPRTKVVTNPIDLFGNSCQVLDPGKVTGNIVVDFNEGAEASQVTWGSNIRLTRAATA